MRRNKRGPSGPRFCFLRKSIAHCHRSSSKEEPRRDTGSGGDAGRLPGGSGGGGGGGDYSDIDPAFIGLLKRLPPVGKPMSARRRTALIDAFKNVVDFLYPEDETA